MKVTFSGEFTQRTAKIPVIIRKAVAAEPISACILFREKVIAVIAISITTNITNRSEERRVGKECRL